ncbi:hypothetical protein [Leptolyngbya sp. FACHB-36]|uniref:hypothetical protein n=1 Tax=Leptolyngbya sp. FACHB-36 TaxID=2692808 RepID=UPI00168033D0|nr:hypothetical protein [Leptolyngbya sp. FACHB-36]
MPAKNWRDPNAKREKITPRIEFSLKREIDRFCAEKGIKVADFARAALINHLSKQKAEST